MIDNKAEKYSFTSPYTYALNNPIVFLDPDGNEVVTVNGSAQKAILNTLTRQDKSYIRFDKNGRIDRDLLNNAKSKSGNFNALRQLVNDDRVFEVNVTDEIVYKDENGALIERSFGPITQSEDKEGNFGFNTGEEGWRGVTQTPGDQAQKYNSPDNTVKISINSSLSQEGQAQILSEEAYGHAFLFSKEKEHRHQVKSTSKGFVETNKPLIKRITEAIKETIQNMNDDDEN